MEEETKQKSKISPVRLITDNAIVAALYYALTMLMVLVPVISQFGAIQCRFSEVMVLLAFFRPNLIPGLTIGCFLANATGAIMGQNLPMDMLLGTGATFIACVLEAYASRFLFIATIWPVLINGVVVGAEIYWLLLDQALPWWATMGYVALGEFIALAAGYALFMILIRNKGFMGALSPSRHENARF